MKNELGVFTRLTERLLEGLHADEPWACFLEELRDQLGATVATLILTPPRAHRPGFMLAPGGNPDVAQDYSANYFQQDLFTGLPEGKVVSFNQFINEPGRRRGELFARMIEIAGSDCIIGLDLRAGSGFEARIRLNREIGGREFDAAECAMLERLVPHLRHAIAIFERLEAAGLERSIYSGAMDRMSVGTIILDHDRKLLSCNAVARDILERRDGLALVGERLSLGTSQQDARLKQQIAQNKLRGDALPSPSVVERVARTSGRDLFVTLRNIAAPRFMNSGKSPALALFINNPERSSHVSNDLIRTRFGLTRSEANLAAALVNGLSLVQAAQTLGVAHNTARVQLQSIFRKLDINRQSQLVQLVHQSLAETPAVEAKDR